MMSLRKITCLAVVVAVLSLVSTTAFSASLHNKPQPPLLISIEPVQPGITPTNIKAGDVVELRIIAASSLDADDVRIQVDLAGGAELVLGETVWNGSLIKNEEKTIIITVRAPAHGNGKIKARILIPESQGASFSAEDVYVLGVQPKSKPEHEHPVKKDSKGRDVIEYR